MAGAQSSIAFTGTASTRDRASWLLFLLGAAVLVAAFCALSLTALALVLHSQPSRAIAPAAMVLSSGFLWWTAGLHPLVLSRRARLKLLAVLAVTILAAGAAAGWFYDLSYDGQTYHQETILLLSEGWNPLQGHVVDRLGPLDDTWINHYPRGSELIASCIYRFTGNIEHGKLFHLLFIMGSFASCLAALLQFRKLRPAAAALSAALLAVNPVAANQVCSFYVDGLVASLLMSLYAIGAMIVLREQHLASPEHAASPSAACRLTAGAGSLLRPAPGVLFLFIWAIGLVVLINLKFTGLVYAAVTTASLLLCVLVVRRGRVRGWPGLAIASLGAAVYGVGFIGYSPYITNTLDHHHPFYPAMGPGAIDFMSTSIPDNFRGRNRAAKLALSVFSRSSNAMTDKMVYASTLKIPFTVSRSEFESTWFMCDTRIAGWGPLFGGAILLAACVWVPAARAAPAPAALAIGVSALILGSVLINPECWWARYTPQLWTLPVIAAVVALHVRTRLLIALGRALLVVLILNTLMVALVYIGSQVRDTRRLAGQFAALCKNSEPIRVYFENMRSGRVRLARAGISFREVGSRTEVPEEFSKPIRFSAAIYCPDSVPARP